MAEGARSERGALVGELFGADGPDLPMHGRLLRTREVALLFQVSERAVTDWARKGRIPSMRTPGGHRRYPADQVRALLLAAGRSDDLAPQRLGDPGREPDAASVAVPDTL